MAEKSPRTKKRGDGHTKAEMNRNREMSFGGALTTRKQGADDAPGASSSRSRGSRSGAERNQSVMAGRGGGGSSGPTARSKDADPKKANRPGAGIKKPKRGIGQRIAKRGTKKRTKRSR